MITIDYKDSALDIIEKINEELLPQGLELKFDDQDHDGFELVSLVRVGSPNTGDE